MGKVVIGAEVKVDGLVEANQTVKSFKAQLREAQQEVTAMSERFGLTSKEAANAAKKVAELKDRIGDAKQLADTFNPDKKFVALSGALQGATSGFSALTGAMGIFGADGKEVEALLLKVNSAMALQQGISGIAGAVDSFKLLAGTIKTSVVSAFGTLKTAMASTGIGLLVIAAGALIAKLYSMRDAISNVDEKTRKYAEAQKKIGEASRKAVADFSVEERAMKALGYAEDVIIAKKKERLTVALYATQQELLAQQKLLEATLLQRKAEESNKFLIGLARAAGVILKETTEEDIQKVSTALDELRGKSGELAVQLLEVQNIGKTKGKDISAPVERKQREAKEIKEAQKSLNEQLREMAAKAAADGEAQADADFAAMKERDEKELQYQRDLEARNIRESLENKKKLAELAALNDPDNPELKIAKLQATLDLELNALAEGDIQKQILAKKTADEISRIKADAAKADIGIAKLSEEQKVQFVADSLGQIADIIGRESAVGKAVAVAQAIINTYQGATKALASLPPPFGGIAAGITIAAGFANVRKIIATKLPGRADTGGQSVPSIGSAATAPLLPQQQTTRLDQSSINQIGNAASRAYVLETDVSTNMERVRRLNRAARIN